MLALVGPILSKVNLSGAHLRPRLGQVGPMWSMLGAMAAAGLCIGGSARHDDACSNSSIANVDAGLDVGDVYWAAVCGV